MHLINSFQSHFQTCAPTCFGSLLPSSGSACVPLKLRSAYMLAYVVGKICAVDTYGLLSAWCMVNRTWKVNFWSRYNLDYFS
jgi:predicted cobalt transporter CbtA